MPRDSRKERALARIMVSLERHSALWLCLVLLLALILRIIALLNFSQSIYSDFLLWDERLYQAWAEGLAKGEPYPGPCRLSPPFLLT